MGEINRVGKAGGACAGARRLDRPGGRLTAMGGVPFASHGWHLRATSVRLPCAHTSLGAPSRTSSRVHAHLLIAVAALHWGGHEPVVVRQDSVTKPGRIHSVLANPR